MFYKIGPIGILKAKGSSKVMTHGKMKRNLLLELKFHIMKQSLQKPLKKSDVLPVSMSMRTQNYEMETKDLQHVTTPQQEISKTQTTLDNTSLNGISWIQSK